MSYLLVQILICLLITGLIIGWLWNRFTHNQKLEEREGLWEEKVKSLVAEHENTLSVMTAKVNKSEENERTLAKNLKVELDNTNSSWETKLQGLREIQSDSNKESETLRAFLSKLELKSKNLREKLIISNNTWESKVQTLIGQQNDNNKKVETLRTALKKSKTIEDNLRIEINEYQAKNKSLKLFFSKSNSDWAYKVEALIAEKNVSDKELESLQSSLLKSEAYSKVMDATVIKMSEESTKEIEELKASLSKLEVEKKVFENDLNKKLNNLNSDWEKKLQDLKSLNKLDENIKDNYAKKNLELNKKLQILELALAQKMKDTNSDEETKELEKLQLALNKSEEDVKSLKLEMEKVKSVGELSKIKRKHKRRVKGMRKEKKVKRHDHKK